MELVALELIPREEKRREKIAGMPKLEPYNS